MWPFSRKQDRAEIALDGLERKLDRLLQDRDQAIQELSAKKAELDILRSKLEDTNKKLRTQTEADLYLSCAKVMRDIMETGKAKPENVDAYQRYMAQIQGMQSQFPPSNPYGSLSGLLAGAGAAFAR